MDVAHWTVFFTFQAISYVVDVRKVTLEKPTRPLVLCDLPLFLPQLVAGPIVRAILPQLESESGFVRE